MVLHQTLLILSCIAANFKAMSDADLCPRLAALAELVLMEPINVTGASRGAMVAYLVRQHVKHSPDSLSRLECYISECLVPLSQKESAKYASITADTLPVLFKTMLLATVEALDVTSSPGLEMPLLAIRRAVAAFLQLINLVRSFNVRNVLSCCLRHGRLFVQTFLKKSVPQLEVLLKTSLEVVIEVLKTLQQATRALQVCICLPKGVSCFASIDPFVRTCAAIQKSLGMLV